MLKTILKDALHRARFANDYMAMAKIAETMYNCKIKNLKTKTKKQKRSL